VDQKLLKPAGKQGYIVVEISAALIMDFNFFEQFFVQFG
jgi:hypothetical protein